MRIVLTGAYGFVGRTLAHVLTDLGHECVRVGRAAPPANDLIVHSIDAHTDWQPVFQRPVDVVIHLAAQVAQGGDVSRASEAQLHQTNVLGTAHLARVSVDHGVGRFIFLSSAKVMGDGQDNPYVESDVPQPSDAYARSKWQAEQELIAIAAQSSMEYVILRPPLVYGPGVKGNFLALVKAVDQARLLPLGGIHNRRSFLYLDNLTSAIAKCLTHQGAANRIFFIADTEEVSTTQLIRCIGQALGRKPRLVSLPLGLIKTLMRIVGKAAAIERLTNSLVLSTHAIERAIDWRPAHRMVDGLAATARWYREEYAMTQQTLLIGKDVRKNNLVGNGVLLRVCDLVFSITGLLLLWPVMLLIYGVGLIETGAPLFRQTRLGRHQQPFTLFKFRTMRVDSPSTATHLVDPLQITRLGAYLRKTKLDELPQLWNVVKGEMSLVGPRPCLANQTELIAERGAHGVFAARPGITGLAQIQGIDMSNPKVLALIDAQMLANLNFAHYLGYLIKTVLGQGSGDRVVRSSGTSDKPDGHS